jgi:PHD/YefM family antitoxin component YafN of YafNO toxin-antitoxin module
MYNTNYSNSGVSDVRVTTADFIKNYGRLADKALSEPVTITKNGHDRLVVLSASEYDRLKRRDRRVVLAGELTEEEVALIAQAEVPAEHAHLDAELKDWRP